MLIACSLGKTFGLIALNGDQQVQHEELADAYGLERRLATVVAMDPPIDEYMLEADDAASDSSSSDSSSESASAGSASPEDCTKDSLETLTAGTLTIGTDSPAYAPWFVDDDPTNGEGYESAVAYAIAEELGYADD